MNGPQRDAEDFHRLITSAGIQTNLTHDSESGKWFVAAHNVSDKALKQKKGDISTFSTDHSYDHLSIQTIDSMFDFSEAPLECLDEFLANPRYICFPPISTLSDGLTKSLEASLQLANSVDILFHSQKDTRDLGLMSFLLLTSLEEIGKACMIVAAAKEAERKGWRTAVIRGLRSHSKKFSIAGKQLKPLAVQLNLVDQATFLHELGAKGKDPKKHGYEETEPIDAKGLPRLPQGWTWTKLSYVCAKIQDGTHFSPPNSAELKGGIPYITAKNIKPHGIDVSEITYVSRRVHEEIYRHCDPEKGDVLYIKDGATTGLAVVNDLDYPFSMLSSVALLKPIKRFVDPSFLKHYLNSPDTFERMTGRMTGTAIKRIILERIREAEFPLAPINEQRIIVEKVETFFHASDIISGTVSRALNLTSQLEQSTLSRAFRGELVPQDPNDEPASVLLERIRAQRMTIGKKGRRRTLEEFAGPAKITSKAQHSQCRSHC